MRSLTRDKSRTPSQYAQKGRTSHPPNPGAPRRALSQARPQQAIITIFPVAGLDESQTARVNEGLPSPRVARAQGTHQANTFTCWRTFSASC